MLGDAYWDALTACVVFYVIMEIRASTTLERITSYVFETQRYRKEMFLQHKKKHCLVVRKEGFFVVACGFVFPLESIIM